MAPGEAIQIRSMHVLTELGDLGAPSQRGVALALADYGPIKVHDVEMGAGLDSLCTEEGGRAVADTVTGDPRVVGVIGTSCSVAATAGDGHLRALDAATGEELWRFQKGYFDGIPSYTVIGGVLYMGSLDGGVYAFIAPLGTTTEGKVLTILYWQAPTLPGPYLSGGTKDLDAGAITLEPLAKYDPDGNLVPALAAQIPTIENGGFPQDLMSITWKLKEGLKWSDGSDMTAEDVVFTWLYCVDEDTGCTAESSFDGIASFPHT